MQGSQDEYSTSEILIDEEDGRSNVYFKYTTVRSFDTVKSLISSADDILFAKKGGFSSFADLLNNLEKYENDHSREFSHSDYKARCGTVFSVMMPRSAAAWTNETLAKVAKELITYLTGEEKNLPCIAVKSKEKSVCMLKIWISDRPFYDYCEAKKYTRDIYIDPQKKQFCARSAKNAVLVHKKGDIILEKDGSTRMVVSHFFPRKTRQFCFESKNAFEDFCNRLKEQFINIILSLKKGFVIKKEMIIRRKKLKAVWNRYLREVTNTNNRARMYIQNTYNAKKSLIMSLFPEQQISSAFGYSESYRVLPDSIAADLNKLLSDYKAIFANDVFWYNGTEISIFKGKPSEVQAACELLMRQFDADIGKIIKKAYEMRNTISGQNWPETQIFANLAVSATI